MYLWVLDDGESESGINFPISLLVEPV